MTLQLFGLGIALISYGSITSTALAQSEVEAQLEELAATGESSFDLGTRLRGAAQRRVGAAATAAGDDSAGLCARARRVEHLGPRVSLGLSLPLRC